MSFLLDSTPNLKLIQISWLFMKINPTHNLKLIWILHMFISVLVKPLNSCKVKKKKTEIHTHINHLNHVFFLSVFPPVFDPECVLENTPNKHKNTLSLGDLQATETSLCLSAFGWRPATETESLSVSSASQRSQKSRSSIPSLHMMSHRQLFKGHRYYFTFSLVFLTSTLIDKCFTEQGQHKTQHDTKPERANTRHTWSKTRDTLTVCVYK